ncbi:MAG: hypothetical protein U5N58_10625 [Actinomycetota bacterium]|nr:hypothetical protein [Actinomycetota bacterium]
MCRSWGKISFRFPAYGRQGTYSVSRYKQKKIKRMEEISERLGIGNIELLEDYATSLKSLGEDRVFDKIFVDAPCSALGTVSKNPDAKYGRNYKDLERLGEKSYQILKCAKDYLRQKGHLIFYTCTLIPGRKPASCKEVFKKLSQF